MFKSKYPIVAVGMNQVSNIHLALAVAKAGAVPTVSGFNYYSSKFKSLNYINIKKDFEYYQASQGNCNFIFSINDNYLIGNNELISLLLNYNVPYIELITSRTFFENNFTTFNDTIKHLKNNNIKIIVKGANSFLLSTKMWIEYINENFDAILIKGTDGAGRILDDSGTSLSELITQSREAFPSKFIIPCGGVGTAEQVKTLIELGSTAVGIGTLFAASIESSLSNEAKQKLVKSSSSDIKHLNTYDYDQNALVFSNVNQNKDNNTEGLILGISTGNVGHIFAGKSIDHITEIKSVKTIVEELCSLL